MMPTADDVARAIVAACRETGAHPLNVVVEQDGPLQIEQAQAISRARAYAAFALDKVCNDDGITIARPRLAVLLGVTRQSKDSYFPGLIHRKVRLQLRWWDDLALHRVIAAIVSGRMEDMTGIIPAMLGVPPAKPPPNIPKIIPAFKAGPLPPVSYRPPPGTIQRVLEDDAEDDGPVFDKGGIGERKGWQPPARDSKQQMADDLAAAVRNTALMTPPPEDD